MPREARKDKYFMVIVRAKELTEARTLFERAVNKHLDGGAELIGGASAISDPWGVFVLAQAMRGIYQE